VISVTLDIDVSKTLEIVNELKRHGWIINKDFDFAYYKPEFETFTGLNYDPIKERHSVFTFYDDSNASYFMLRWG